MIEKITDQNLERYDSRLKEWCDRKFFEKGNYGKYQTTEEAGAVAFYPAPNTPLEGKVKFSFKETMPAEGIKGLDNPSTIIGVNSIKVTRCGKNLIKTPFFSTSESYVLNEVTFTVNHNDGTFTVNGTASPNDARLYFVGATSRIRLLGGKQYRLSGCPSGGSSNTYAIGASRYSVDGTTYLSSLPSDVGSGVLWDIATDCSFVSSVWIKAGTEVSNLVFKPQVELGFTATSFEPYSGNDYTIDLDGTYYGGEIDLATGVMTVTWEKIDVNPSVLDAFASYLTYVGTDTVGIAVSCEGLGGRTKIKQYKSAFSNRFEQTDSDSYTVDTECIYTTTGSSNCVLKINKSRLPNDVDYTNTDSIKNAFIEWFTNNSTYIVYKLETPFTVQLTTPQIFSLIQTNKYTPRLNTVYTDADSVQISYLKSPIRDEYEKTQAILSLGGNS